MAKKLGNTHKQYKKLQNKLTCNNDLWISWEITRELYFASWLPKNGQNYEMPQNGRRINKHTSTIQKNTLKNFQLAPMTLEYVET